MTWVQTLVCFDPANSELVHIPLEAVTEAYPPVQIQPGTFLSDGSFEAELCLPSPRATMPGSICTSSILRVTAERARFAAGPRTINLRAANLRARNLRAGNRRAAGKYLCANNDQRVSAIADDPKEWETYLLVTKEDLADLAFLRSNDWIKAGSSQRVRRLDTKLLDGFRLILGDIELSLPDVLPLRHARRALVRKAPSSPLEQVSDILSVPLFRDGWKLDAIHLYRPLVYFTAFHADAVLDQVATSIRSLIDISGYDGKIGVLTDRVTDLAARLPAGLLDRVKIVFTRPSGPLGYLTARYRIFEHERAWKYQPLLYCDSDTVFDTDIGGFLGRVALCDRITAPREPWSLMRESRKAGADLLAAEALPAGDMVGVNSGTLAFPNLTTCAADLGLILDTAERYAASPVAPERPGDQEVANYYRAKSARIEDVIASDYVRFALDGQPVNPDEPLGIVHFFGFPSAEAKSDAMKAYARSLPHTDGAYAA